MHEALFLKLLQGYESAGLSLSRIISDPQFKSIPLEERIALLRKFAPRIKQGTKVDKTLWSDFALGSVGMAIAGYPVAKGMVQSAIAGGKIRDEYEETGKFNPKDIPHLTMGDVGVMSLGISIGGSPMNSARTFMRDRGLVNRYLSKPSEHTTTDNAIDVIART